MSDSSSPKPSVVIAGAGPGAPDLITLRARRALDEADLIVYAGSLTNPLLFASCREGCRLEDSSHLNLEEQVRIMAEAAKKGQMVVRLHSGDPSLYGAIREQIRALADEGVECTVIPGVTSAFAAAAALAVEYTVPNVSQSLVFTRSAGRTPLPDSQKPAAFARTGATLVFYLSSGHFSDLTRELTEEGGLPATTPCAVVYRASWPEQRILRGTLADIADQAREAGIQRQALLLVGEAIEPSSETKSLLYDGHFSHGYRNDLADERFTGSIGVLAYSPKGRVKAEEICQGLGSQAVLLPRGTHFRDVWGRYEALVCVAATGLIVRLAAPLLKDKSQDPALVCVDDRGRFAVSLCGGHLAGANRLARRVARITAGQAVVSTATDSGGITAFDEAAAREGARVLNTGAILPCNRALLHGKAVDFYGPEAVWTKYFAGLKGLRHCAEPPADPAPLCVCWDAPVPEKTPCALQISSRAFVLGAGCHSGIDVPAFIEEAKAFLERSGVPASSVAALASHEAKAGEKGMLALAEELGCPFRGYPGEVLAKTEGVVTLSHTVAKHMGTPSVSEAAALTAARELGATARLAAAREVRRGSMTFALARIGHNRPEKPAVPEGGELIVAGLGSGQPGGITGEVLEALRSADAIAGYTTYTAFVRPLLEAEGLRKEYIQSGMCGEIERCRRALEAAMTGRRVCLVCSGDPGLLAMAGLILEMQADDPRFARIQIRILPGVTAALLAAARLGAPLQNGAVLISLSDLLVPAEEVRGNLKAALSSALPLALYNPAGKKRRDLLREALAMAAAERGSGCLCATVRSAARPDEEVWIGRVDELDQSRVDMSTLLIICGRRTRRAGGWLFEDRGYGDKYADRMSGQPGKKDA